METMHLMKRFFAIFCSIFFNILCSAQRSDGTRSYDVVGLPKAEKIIGCIEKGSPFLIIGLIMLYICIKSTKRATRENRKEKDSWWGCLSLILIGVGVIIMLPLFAWIEFVVASIISIVAVVGIAYAIYDVFRNN